MNPSRELFRKRVLRAPLGAALLALTTLAACAGSQGTVYNKNFTAGYSPSSLSALRTPLLVETFGAPAAGLSQENVTTATVRGLRERGPRWATLNYSGDPADSPNPAYRLRVAYGASKAFGRSELCGENLQASDIGNDGTSPRTMMALCRGQRYVSIAEGSPGLEADIDSAAFSSFVGLIGRQMMPRNNPVVVNDCILRRCD